MNIIISKDGRDVSVCDFWVDQATWDAYVEASNGNVEEQKEAKLKLLQMAKPGYVLASWNGDFDSTEDSNNGIYIAQVTGRYFEGDGSEKAVVDAIDQLLDAGKVSVNGSVIPAKEPEKVTDQLDENGRKVLIDVNGFRGLWYQKNLDTIDIDGDHEIEIISKWTWQAHDRLMSDKGYKSTKGSPYMLQVPMLGDETEEQYREGGFAFARRHFVLALSMLRGNKTTILAGDAPNGGRTKTAAEIVFDVWSGCQVEKMIDNGDGTTTMYGVPVDASSYNTDGGPNDREPKTFRNDNIASDVVCGTSCFYRKNQQGQWEIKRLNPRQGILNSSGSNYDIALECDGTSKVYCDALVTRYNMQGGSRPLQVLSSVVTLGLGSVPVTLWVTDADYVVGISHMEYADEALKLAIAAGNVLTEDPNAPVGKIVPVGPPTPPEPLDKVLEELKAAVAHGKDILGKAEYTNAQKDAAIYSISDAFIKVVKAR